MWIPHYVPFLFNFCIFNFRGERGMSNWFFSIPKKLFKLRFGSILTTRNVQFHLYMWIICSICGIELLIKIHKTLLNEFQFEWNELPTVCFMNFYLIIYECLEFVLVRLFVKFLIEKRHWNLISSNFLWVFFQPSELEGIFRVWKS